MDKQHALTLAQFARFKAMFPQPPETAPSLRLAIGHGPQPGIAASLATPPADDLPKPALLVSYWYLGMFQRQRHRYQFRDWVLDSGAYSARQCGAQIDLQEYIAACQQLLATDPLLTEVYALDVIGDWQASLRNYQTMWKAGVPAIPCFHYGDDETLLREIAHCDKIALGGMAGELATKKDRLRWQEQVFARVWPKKIHAFGNASEEVLLARPWHSADASNWEIGPSRFGTWKAYGGHLSVRGSNQQLKPEVERFLRLEAKVRAVWHRRLSAADWAMLQSPTPGPSVRLALAASRQGRDSTPNAF